MCGGDIADIFSSSRSRMVIVGMPTLDVAENVDPTPRKTDSLEGQNRAQAY